MSMFRGCLATITLVVIAAFFAPTAQADIYQWEYINPSDPSAGKQESATLAPDGAGRSAVPGAKLNGIDLGKGYFVNADLTDADFGWSKLAEAAFDNADLQNTRFQRADLQDATLTDAVVRDAGFEDVTNLRPGQIYSTASYKQKDLGAIKLVELDLSAWDFTEQSLIGARFWRSNLTNAGLSGANLTHASLARADLAGADLTDAVLSQTSLQFVQNLTESQISSTASYKQRSLIGVDFYGVQAPGWDFSHINLSDSVFRQASLVGADLSHTKLTAVSLYGADITNANFIGADITDTNFSYAIGMTDTQFHSTANYLNKTLEGVNLTRQDLTGWDFSDLVINHASFSDTTLALDQLYATANYKNGDLRDITLSLTDLQGADLTGQDLSGSVLFGADLTGADLTGAIVDSTDLNAILINTNLSGVDLSTASLYAATLNETDLSGKHLAGQSFSRAKLIGTNLSDAQLAESKWGSSVILEFDAEETAFSAGGITTFADVTGADVTRADLRDATFLTDDMLASMVTTNAIRPDGTVRGLDLGDGITMCIRDYGGDTPITIEQGVVMAPAAVLKMIFDDDLWPSTIGFDDDGSDALLDGTLMLTLGDGADPHALLGTTFDLFDWDHVTRSGAFDVRTLPWMTWDTSDLYTTGEVTLVGIPEPVSLALLALGGVCVLRKRPRLTAS